MMQRFESFYTLKTVRSRKAHDCVVCSEAIPSRRRVLHESGFNSQEGYFSNYFHTDPQNGCHLDYIDALQPNDDVCEKIKDSEYFGDIYHHHKRRRR